MRHVVMLAGLCALVALIGCTGSNSTTVADPKVEPKADPGPPPVAWSADMQKVAEGHNRFAIELYAKLREKKGNVFFSPYSVHTALAMTATGAKGDTRTQMLKALHLPEDKVLASGDLGRFYSHPRKEFELSVANALWGQKGVPWRAEWLATQNERFGAGFNEADFKADPEGERLRINKWVEEKTREKIKDLLLPKQVTEQTRMVLTNAIYFKGKWLAEFKKEATQNAPFKCDDGTKVDVPMMWTDAEYPYADVDGVTMVELWYQGEELAMVVVLPKPGEKLSELEKRLTPELAAKWFGEFRRVGSKADVALPKFKIESRYGMSDHLKALGIEAAFDPDSADFSGMASEPALFISGVVHKAFVEVNEEGTEAAAATAIVTDTPVSDQTGVRHSFRADRPFLFFIRDAKHGTILFMGRVEKP